jgi:hypothetical protein
MFRSLCALALLALSPLAGAQDLPSWATAPPAPADEVDGGSPPAEDAGPVLPPPPPPVPVDGGLALLALAGAGYAAHRLRRRA